MTQQPEVNTTKFYLVGAGPGDPGLLTVRASELLKRADVVLFDRLVGDEVLKAVPAHAELIYVGKDLSGQEQGQRRIFEHFVRFAGSGKQIVRLKGGDPTVFGRGGEEWLFLRELGMEVEVVPGISSSIAVPALAGIPLTLRGISASFAVITGQRGGSREVDWSAYSAVDTLVILMGVNDRRIIAQSLIRAGRPPSEQAAFIENGTTPRERIITTTLGRIASGEAEVKSPAVFVVGEVVRFREKLSGLTAELSTENSPECCLSEAENTYEIAKGNIG